MHTIRCERYDMRGKITKRTVDALKAGNSLADDEIRGFVVSDMNEQLASFFKVKGGVLVKRVAPDSIAARTGLKAGDVIVTAQDQEMTSVEQLVKLLNTKISKLTLKVIRNNQPVTILFVSN